MKSLLFTAILLLGLSFHTQAQSTDKRARVRYLFSLMKQDSLMLKQMDATVAIARNITKMSMGTLSAMGVDSSQVPIDSAQLKRNDIFMQKMIKVAKENTMKMINEDMVEVYDRFFTAEDIEAFCTFYQSPAGRKMIDRTPAITEDIRTRSMNKYQPEIMNLFKEHMDESKRAIDQKYNKSTDNQKDKN